MQPVFVVKFDSYSQNKCVVILIHLMLLFRCFLDFEDGTLWAFIGPIIPVFLVSTPFSIMFLFEIKLELSSILINSRTRGR